MPFTPAICKADSSSQWYHIHCLYYLRGPGTDVVWSLSVHMHCTRMVLYNSFQQWICGIRMFVLRQNVTVSRFGSIIVVSNNSSNNVCHNNEWFPFVSDESPNSVRQWVAVGFQSPWTLLDVSCIRGKLHLNHWHSFYFCVVWAQQFLVQFVLATSQALSVTCHCQDNR